MPSTAANRGTVAASSPWLARPDGAWAAGSNIVARHFELIDHAGGLIDGGHIAAEDDAVDLSIARLLPDGGDRATDFGRPASAGGLHFGWGRAAGRSASTRPAAGKHNEVGFVGERVDDQRHAVGRHDAGAMNERRGGARPQHDPTWLDVERLTNFAGLAHAGRAERDGQNLMLASVQSPESGMKSRAASDAEGRELALGLEPHHVGQFVGWGGRKRQQLHLHVVAADADEHRGLADGLPNPSRRPAPRRPAWRSGQLPRPHRARPPRRRRSTCRSGPTAADSATHFVAIPVDGKNAGHVGEG